jgi:hypothetical protein
MIQTLRKWSGVTLLSIAYEYRIAIDKKKIAKMAVAPAPLPKWQLKLDSPQEILPVLAQSIKLSLNHLFGNEVVNNEIGIVKRHP